MVSVNHEPAKVLFCLTGKERGCFFKNNDSVFLAFANFKKGVHIVPRISCAFRDYVIGQAYRFLAGVLGANAIFVLPISN